MMWDVIVSVPDHCLSFYFVSLNNFFTTFHNELSFSFLIFYEMLIADNITEKVQGILMYDWF